MPLTCRVQYLALYRTGSRSLEHRGWMDRQTDRWTLYLSLIIVIFETMYVIRRWANRGLVWVDGEFDFGDY